MSPADYPYLLDYHPSFTTTLNAEVYPRTLGTNSLTGLPSNQVCRPFLSSSPYNDDKWTSHECDYYRTTFNGLMTGTIEFFFNPCGNYSDTSNLRFLMIKGSLGPSFEVSISTEYQNQESFYPYVLHEISVLIELSLGHLCCLLTDVPPQPNSPTDNVFNLNLELTSFNYHKFIRLR